MNLRKQLLEECRRLTREMKYDDREGFHYWDVPSPFLQDTPIMHCGGCTNGARLIAEKFCGYVAGYPIAFSDSQKLVGAMALGHDFAVVEDLIVDWWGCEYEESLRSPVLVTTAGIDRGLYKPFKDWTIYSSNDFRVRGHAATNSWFTRSEVCTA